MNNEIKEMKELLVEQKELVLEFHQDVIQLLDYLSWIKDGMNRIEKSREDYRKDKKTHVREVRGIGGIQKDDDYGGNPPNNIARYCPEDGE